MIIEHNLKLLKVSTILRPPRLTQPFHHTGVLGSAWHKKLPHAEFKVQDHDPALTTESVLGNEACSLCCESLK